MSGKLSVLCLVSLIGLFSGIINSCFAATAVTLDQAKQKVITLIDARNFTKADSATNKLIADFNNGHGVDEAVHQISLKYQEAKNYQKEIELSRVIIKNWPDSSQAGWAQMDIVIANLSIGDETAVQAEVETLINNYKDNPDLSKMLYIIGQGYKSEAFGQILKKHFDSNSPAKVNLAIMHADVMAKIESGDFNAAGKTVDKMIAEYSSDTDLPEMLLTVAQQLVWRHQYELAGSIYQHIIQKFPTSPSADKAQQCLKKSGQINDIVSKLIDSGDYGKVNKAIQELIDKFGDEADTPATIYDIAGRLESAGKLDFAKQAYEQIIWRYPKSGFADMSRIGVRRTKVLSLEESGDEAGAKAAFNGISKDFKGNAYLASNIMLTAEGYYRKACKAKEKGDSELAKKLFDKTMTTLSDVNAKFPASDEVPNALYLAGECYYQLEDYQKAADTFQNVADGYPKFQMASNGNALFMVAESQKMLKRSKAVSESEADSKIRAAYEQLLQKYPGSPLVAAAQQWLDKNSSK